MKKYKPNINNIGKIIINNNRIPTQVNSIKDKEVLYELNYTLKGERSQDINNGHVKIN